MADAEPTLLLPITVTFRLASRSSSVGAYVELVAPTMALQMPLLQRFQVYELEIGVEPLHVPGDAVKVAPTTGWPLIVGREAFCGAAAGAAGGAAVMSAVKADVAVDEPNLFLAVTRTRMP